MDILRAFVAGIILLLMIGCGDRSSGDAFAAKKGKYSDVANRVLKGELQSNQSGVAKLPADLATASVGGEIYTSSKNGLTVIAFRTWRGKGYNMEGFLFCSRPLVPTDLERDYDGNNTIEVGPTRLTIERQVEPQWYFVTRRLD